MKNRKVFLYAVVLFVAFFFISHPTIAQINVITVDITPFVSPGDYSFGPGNTMGMALQAVDQGSDFNVTEVTPAAFSAMTAAQLSQYDLIAINNHPGRIAGGLGTVWHDVVGIETGGRVVLNSHDAPRFKMTVPPGGGWFGAGSPGPGVEPFGTYDLIRQAALWAGGVPGQTGLLIFNDAARFFSVGGFGWDNPELALPAAWGITDADQSGGFTAPGGGYTDILPAFETHPLYLGLSDSRFGVNSISSFAANIVDSSFHSIFATYNPAIFTPTEVIINSGIIDPGGWGGQISGNATVNAPNGTAITLIRDTAAELTVSLDIKPTSCPNPLNVKSNGVLPVAILGSEGLDVTTIDVATILLEGVNPIRSALEDVATPVSNGPGLPLAQINVITVDITPFVSPGNSVTFGPFNTMGMALQAVDQGSDFNVTEVTPAAFSVMTAAQLSGYDLIAINNHPGRIAGGLGTVWHDVVGIETGGRVVLNSHDAPRFKMIVPPGTGWFGAGSPGPGVEPFGTHDLIRQAALWAGGVPGQTGLLIFNDSARFFTVGGFGWDNPELALPAAWGITDADQSGGSTAPGGGYTDILPAFETHPLYLGLSDSRFGVNSISSFAANIVDSSFHSIFATYNPAIFTPTEVIINSGIIDPGGWGDEISGFATVNAPNGTAITLIRGDDDVDDCECTTEGPDGYLDLTLKFYTQEIAATLGEVDHGDELLLTLEGALFEEFGGTPIKGADCITIRGKHKPLNTADINKDGVVDMLDLSIISENWLQSSLVK